MLEPSIGMMPQDCERLVHGEQLNTVRIAGHDMPDATIVANTTACVVLRVPGRSYWAMRHGARGYAPAEYRVFEKVEGKYLREIANFPVKQVPDTAPRTLLQVFSEPS